NLERVLDSFLKKQLEELAPKHGEKAPLELLAAMISERHTKLQVSAADLQQHLTDNHIALLQPLPELLRDLEEHRILRALKSGELTHYEITHDLLAKVVGDNLTPNIKLRKEADKIYQVYLGQEGLFSEDVVNRLRSFKVYLAYPIGLEEKIVASEQYQQAQKEANEKKNAKELEEANARAEQEAKLRKEAVERKNEAEIARKEAEIERQKAIESKNEAETERQKAEKGRKRARTFAYLAAVVAAVAIGLGVFAFFKQREAKAATAVAEAATAVAIVSKEEAQISKQAALDSAAVAQQQRQIANDQVLATLLANKNTAEALRKLEITADQAVTIVLPDIDHNIYRLEYDVTYPKCQTALNLKARRREVEKRVWEMAYFYTEADSAVAAVAFLNLLKPTGLSAGTAGVQAKLRAYLAATVPANYLDSLKERYYPKLVLVEGGSFLREDSAQVQVDHFYMGETEITYWQFNVFARAKKHHIEPPSWEFAGDNPAVYINWYDAAFYLNWLSDQRGKKHVYVMTNREKGTWGTDSDVEIDATANGYR
ncbi:MAG: SUMF1/EgtB/PvdO family nonheme iron enzyme, partial [Saprospiraceae bacterium]|nr:SUMF1/EgtB/PvdO family nonheme iron enzyme [Saprospiraceae bacterium]